MQRHLRLRLPPDGRPEYIRRMDESILNDHREREPQAVGVEFARVLRRAAQEAMRAVTDAPPVCMPLAVAWARCLLSILKRACQLALVPVEEATISTEGGWACHTVLDHVAALERTIQDGRAPRFASARDEQYQELITRLDTLGAIVAATAAKVGVRAEEVWHE